MHFSRRLICSKCGACNGVLNLAATVDQWLADSPIWDEPLLEDTEDQSQSVLVRRIGESAELSARLIDETVTESHRVAVLFERALAYIPHC
jgi:hypothetical protein